MVATSYGIGVLLWQGEITMRSLFETLHACTRIGALWFLAAFLARPLNDLFHAASTRWMVKQRRYLGLAFAAWHLQHLWVLPLLGWVLTPGRFLRMFWRTGNFFPATITLLLIIAMTVTSTDRAQRSMGAAWKALHKVGIYAIWALFVIFYWHGYHKAPRVYVAVLLVMFGVAMAIRIFAFVKQRAMRTGQSS